MAKHGVSLFDLGVRVPLIFGGGVVQKHIQATEAREGWSSDISRGYVTARGVHTHSDIMPTVLDLLRLPNDLVRRDLSTVGLAGRSIVAPPSFTPPSITQAAAVEMLNPPLTGAFTLSDEHVQSWSERQLSRIKARSQTYSSSCSIEMFGQKKIAFVIAAENRSGTGDDRGEDDALLKVSVTYKGCREMNVLAVEIFDLLKDPAEKRNLWTPPRTIKEMLLAPWLLGLRRFWFSCRIGASVMHQKARAGSAELASWARRVKGCAAHARAFAWHSDMSDAWATAIPRGRASPLPLPFFQRETTDSSNLTVARCRSVWLEYIDKKVRRRASLLAALARSHICLARLCPGGSWWPLSFQEGLS